jgi:hypothetical protein
MDEPKINAEMITAMNEGAWKQQIDDWAGQNRFWYRCAKVWKQVAKIWRKEAEVRLHEMSLAIRKSVEANKEIDLYRATIQEAIDLLTPQEGVIPDRARKVVMLLIKAVEDV